MLFRRLKIALPSGLKIFKQGTRSLFGLRTEYRYRNFSIRLPADHLLPFYQSMHGTYDKFLPHLVRHLEPNATVIDVGANCGDTLAGMYDANDRLSYICVEPDEVFFEYLSENALRMRSSNPSASIRLYKALVGKGVRQAALEGSGGTKHAVQVDGSLRAAKAIPSSTLDSLLLPMQSGRVELLKSDVDGFDFDVLDSAATLIAEHLPILFFECHFGDLNQKHGYQQTIAALQRSGYRTWTVFDNYGDVVLRTPEIEALFQLFNYVDRQNAGLTTRTIHYFDVMAGTERHEALLTTAVSDYLQRATVLDCIGLGPTAAAFQKENVRFEMVGPIRWVCRATPAIQEPHPH
jgi:FkbM family methyltransferase